MSLRRQRINDRKPHNATLALADEKTRRPLKRIACSNEYENDIFGERPRWREKPLAQARFYQRDCVFSSSPALLSIPLAILPESIL